ncbi:MAG TPA: peptide ABC transporter ATP-binding protein, partial [Ruminococcaceae bacterium]|nr:peptide ABC transporter ATP-binding protein [Oscillospiraceae bacterium]
YPHEFSGGMRQRAMIAMALSCHPKLLIADEPTTALDVTIQAQIMELMQKIRDETGTSIILITHDLGVVANLADRVAVMYAGKIVEQGSARDIFYRAAHPYTAALLRSLPTVETSRSE